jgi:hypothetical protein
VNEGLTFVPVKEVMVSFKDTSKSLEPTVRKSIEDWAIFVENALKEAGIDWQTIGI